MATRKILAIIIVLAIVLVVVYLSGCSSNKVEYHDKDVESATGGLVCISGGEELIEKKFYEQYILYDPDTLVMYTLIVEPKTRIITMSVLYNADGTPKLYNPDNN